MLRTEVFYWLARLGFIRPLLGLTPSVRSALLRVQNGPSGRFVNQRCLRPLLQPAPTEQAKIKAPVLRTRAFILVGSTGVEPATPAMSRRCSATELRANYPLGIAKVPGKLKGAAFSGLFEVLYAAVRKVEPLPANQEVVSVHPFHLIIIEFGNLAHHLRSGPGKGAEGVLDLG